MRAAAVTIAYDAHPLDVLDAMVSEVGARLCPSHDERFIELWFVHSGRVHVLPADEPARFYEAVFLLTGKGPR